MNLINLGLFNKIFRRAAPPFFMLNIYLQIFWFSAPSYFRCIQVKADMMDLYLESNKMRQSRVLFVEMHFKNTILNAEHRNILFQL